MSAKIRYEINPRVIDYVMVVSETAKKGIAFNSKEFNKEISDKILSGDKKNLRKELAEIFSDNFQREKSLFKRCVEEFKMSNYIEKYTQLSENGKNIQVIRLDKEKNDGRRIEWSVGTERIASVRSFFGEDGNVKLEWEGFSKIIERVM